MDAQCHLRHDVVHCKSCKCFVLHGKLATHRRGEDHRLKCGFGKWKAYARRPPRTILPVPYVPYVPKLKPSKKRTGTLARRKELAGIGGEAEARHLSVSGEEGLDFKSVIIKKMADNVSLTLVDVAVTGAGSQGFSAIPSVPMKIKGKKPRTIHVSFVPAAPGEWDARLVLRFLHVSLGKGDVILEITRGLHGVATSSSAGEPGDKNRTPGVRASQKHLRRGTRQRPDTGRDSPKSY